LKKSANFQIQAEKKNKKFPVSQEKKAEKRGKRKRENDPISWAFFPGQGNFPNSNLNLH
jgi:hypothetical protein